MSTLYLLTLISDRCKELVQLTKKLKKQDNIWDSTDPNSITDLNKHIAEFRKSIDSRRNALIVENGGTPEKYEF